MENNLDQAFEMKEPKITLMEKKHCRRGIFDGTFFFLFT